MPRFDISSARSERLGQLAAEPLDVLIIGGGIVGAGIARDAAMRGLRVALVEQYDLAFGTSSRSSRLLHGGLRYLAQGRIGLVYEASGEKRVLHRIAPHLAAPLPFLFPTYRGTQWPLWKLRIGVKLYDLLCGGRNLGPSSGMNREQVLAQLPGLDSSRLTGAVRYFDGLTNDARLVLDTLRSAAAAGATILNYTRWENASRDDVGWRSNVADTLGGQQHEVRSHAVVNATGPWAEMPTQSSIELRLTKGVHLVVERNRLPVPEAVVLTEGSRILFAIPWGKRVILGTTDTDYNGPIEAVRTESADIEYILRIVNRSFPAAQLAAADVKATWAGLRPLIADRHGRPSDISRAHEIRMPAPGWFDVAGGKLTTYRLIAEQVVDRLGRSMGRKFPRCRTADEPLLPEQVARQFSGIVPPRVSQAAVSHFCESEWAVHLDDVMVRRAAWHYYEDDSLQIAEQVSHWMAGVLGWDETARQSEVARYRQLPF